MKYLNIVGGILCALMIWIGSHQQPGPDPKPPHVDPKPYTPLIAGDGLAVLIVYESNDVSPQLSDLMYAEGWQTLVNESGGQFGIFDQNQVISDPKWRDALARDRTSLPWVVVSGKKSGFEGPLPVKEEELIALIREHAG